MFKQTSISFTPNFRRTAASFIMIKMAKIKEQSESNLCPVCGDEYPAILGDHIRVVHDEDTLKELIFSDKEQGIPDVKIGALYGISFNYLEKVITERTGTNISLLKAKKIKSWEPKNYHSETSTVWSFKNRGNWATHDGRYRGNWSP